MLLKYNVCTKKSFRKVFVNTNKSSGGDRSCNSSRQQLVIRTDICWLVKLPGRPQTSLPHHPRHQCLHPSSATSASSSSSQNFVARQCWNRSAKCHSYTNTVIHLVAQTQAAYRRHQGVIKYHLRFKDDNSNQCIILQSRKDRLRHHRMKQDIHSGVLPILVIVHLLIDVVITIINIKAA